jgi:uncharacterized protein (TIGR03083 family)
MADAADADVWIEATRLAHDAVAGRARGLDTAGLTRQSGCSEWDVAQVLGHLGSASEIQLAIFRAALDGTEAPGPEAAPPIWDRWNALGPDDKAAGFLDHGERLVATIEALDPTERADLRIKMSFLPDPIDVGTFVSFRLNELTFHGWDVAVATDPGAVLLPSSLALMADRLGTMITYFGHPEELKASPVTIAVRTVDPPRSFGLSIGDAVSLTAAPADPDATLRLPTESWLRLAVGRLKPPFIPDSVAFEADGLDLDDLRRVFPGI